MSKLIFSFVVILSLIASCGNKTKEVEIIKNDLSITKKTTKLNRLESQIETINLRDSIVNFAVSLLGTPYKTAACGIDGFDCSGFVYYVFQEFNFNIPRSTSGYQNFGTEIPIEEVQKGDVLLFKSPTRNAVGHIGIVSTANGMESKFIHSTSGKAMSVVITSLTNAGYKKRFISAIRIID